MAIQEQRPVYGGEVEEHDHQDEEVIDESKETQHTCRIKSGRDVIKKYMMRFRQ